MERAAVFLDRDGTIIEDRHYIRDPGQVVLLPSALAGLKEMARKGYLLFVVSNQSGVGQGIISDDQFLAVHSRVCEILQAESVPVAQFLYCFHHPQDGCFCRKPKPGLIPRDFEGDRIDWKASYTVGDKRCDLELADAIGAKGALVLTGKGEQTRRLLEESGDKKTSYSIYADLARAAEGLPLSKCH